MSQGPSPGAPNRLDALRGALDPVPIGVVIFDGLGLSLLANRAARDLLGSLATAALDTWWRSHRFLRPDGSLAEEEDLPPCRTLRDRSAHVEAELCFRRWSDRVLPLLVSSRCVLDPDGDIVQIACSLTPIAEHTRRQELERHRNRFEAIGGLLAGVGGPLNDALTAIAGYCDLAAERLADSDPVRALVDEIRQAGERATVLTGRLLAHGQREVPVAKVLALDPWLATQAASLPALCGNGVRLDFAPNAPDCRVEADPRLLQQILAELLANAREAMPHGGRVEIATSCTAYEASGGPAPDGAEATYGILSVRDEGGGIEERAVRHVFDPFFTTRAGSLGLGLATVDRLVRAQGGHVRLENRWGEGVTFHVLLPLAPEPVLMPSVHAPEEPTATDRPVKVLLVEDDVVVRDLVRELLEREGHLVLEARDAAQAQEVFAAHAAEPPDLLVGDVMLPGQGGLALAQELRQRHPGLRVLLMSGCGDRDLLARVLSDRDAAFLPKPFSGAALLAEVDALLAAPVPARDAAPWPEASA